MRITRTLGLAGALVVSALVGGTLINAALATETETPEGEVDRSAYCDVFLDAFAADLGVSTDEVTAAGKTGAIAVIDAALAAGDITDDQAERLRARVTDADGSGCGLFKAGWLRGFAHGVGHGAAHGWARGIMTGDIIEAAADALDLSSADLIAQLREAGSLQAIVESAGADYASVSDSIITALQADLDATNLPDARRAAIIERVSSWLEDGGEVGGLRSFHRDRGSDSDADDAGA